MDVCSYCGSNLTGASINGREMMFGRRTQFEYRLCNSCGSCCLITPLDQFDLASYYGDDYYSFKPDAEEKNDFKNALLRHRGRHEMGARDLLGAILHALKPGDAAFLLRYGVTLDSRVLDVGCGSGAWLAHAAQYGLTNLRGCDPFISQDIEAPNVKIEKCRIEEVTGRFDFIFFHHSFEHLVDPRSGLAAARRLQDASGTCVIRVPTTTSDAFDQYRADWVQLDPPRHLTIPSREGMRRLAEACGYRLQRMIDDSTAFQFWGSEQYLSDIPLCSEQSWGENPARSIFTAEQIERFEADAQELNAKHRGDQTAFVLQAV